MKTKTLDVVMITTDNESLLEELRAINAVKEPKFYTKEEVIDLLHEVIKDTYSHQLEEHYNGDYRNLKDWIKNNL